MGNKRVWKCSSTHLSFNTRSSASLFTTYRCDPLIGFAAPFGPWLKIIQKLGSYVACSVFAADTGVILRGARFLRDAPWTTSVAVVRFETRTFLIFFSCQQIHKIGYFKQPPLRPASKFSSSSLSHPADFEPLVSVVGLPAIQLEVCFVTNGRYNKTPCLT
jgi:hypothetical protein